MQAPGEHSCRVKNTTADGKGELADFARIIVTGQIELIKPTLCDFPGKRHTDEPSLHFS